MKRVVIEELTTGMILAKPVTNNAGLVVLPVGAEVEGEAGDASGKTLDELEAELDHRFRLVAQDPIQCLLREAIRLHLRTTHGISDNPEATPSA